MVTGVGGPEGPSGKRGSGTHVCRGTAGTRRAFTQDGLSLAKSQMHKPLFKGIDSLNTSEVTEMTSGPEDQQAPCPLLVDRPAVGARPLMTFTRTESSQGKKSGWDKRE